MLFSIFKSKSKPVNDSMFMDNEELFKYLISVLEDADHCMNDIPEHNDYHCKTWNDIEAAIRILNRRIPIYF